MKASRTKVAGAVLLALGMLAFLVAVTEPSPKRERAAALRHPTPLYYEAATLAVNTDSLYRLYHAAMRSQHPDDFFLEIMCEGFRLGVRHGVVPMTQAVKRMTDTLWSPAEAKRLPYFNAHLERTVDVDYRTCGMSPDFPRAPIAMDMYPYNLPPAKDSATRNQPAKQPNER